MLADAFISVDQMKLVLDVSRHLAVTADLDALLKMICDSCRGMLTSERASIFLHDGLPDELVTKVATGTGEIRVPARAGIVGSVFKSNRLINIPIAYEDLRFNREVDRRLGFVTRNLLTCPMVNLAGQPIGVIQAVNKFDGAFSGSDELLIQLLADQAGVAIQRYQLQQSAMKTAELQREMDLAKKVQDALIPKVLPECAGLECAGWTQSASTTGGDAYDLWRLPDGRLAAFLADASGHGLAPALVVSQARTIVRSLAPLESDPRKLMGYVNARLAEDLDPGMFVTAFLAFIAPDGELCWFSAGQGPILLRRCVNEPMEVLEPTAPPLGILPEWPDEPCEPQRLAPGGLLAVCSDGIFEAFNPQRDLFDIERVQKVLDQYRAAPAVEMLEAIRAAVFTWQDGTEPKDDQTIMLIKRTI